MLQEKLANQVLLVNGDYLDLLGEQDTQEPLDLLEGKDHRGLLEHQVQLGQLVALVLLVPLVYGEELELQELQDLLEELDLLEVLVKQVVQVQPDPLDLPESWDHRV